MQENIVIWLPWGLFGLAVVIALLELALLSKMAGNVLRFKEAYGKARKKADGADEYLAKEQKRIESIASQRIAEVKMLADRDIRALANRVRAYDAEKDMEWLLFTIDAKINQTIRYKLLPELRQGERRRKLLRDDNLEEVAEEIVAQVMASLSDTYKREALGRYIKQDQLVLFVADTVYISLLSEVIAINDKQIRKIKGQRKMVELRELSRDATRRAVKDEPITPAE